MMEMTKHKQAGKEEHANITPWKDVKVVILFESKFPTIRPTGPIT